MRFHRDRSTSLILVPALLLAASVANWSSPAFAAEQRFVGVLALASEDAVAEKLKLSAEQREQLAKVIDEREAKALGLAVDLKDASPQEQEEKLAPFRQESEAAGLAILTEEQRGLLEQLRLQKLGAAALAEAAVAEKLKFSDEKKTEIRKLLDERDAELRRSNERSRDEILRSYDRRLLDVLDAGQRQEWAKLAGLPDPAGQSALAEPKPAAPTNDKPPMAAGEPKPKGDGKVSFSFQFTPWADVIQWFADQADLSLVMEFPPPGTFNYRDSHRYTPAEAIDLLNGVLLTKGFTLVRRNRMLMVINLEDGIPPELVPDVSLKELDKKGEFELVRVLFRLDRMTPDEAETEIRPVLGTQGRIDKFQKAGLIRVTETAGRLQMIRSVLARIDPAVKEPLDSGDGTGSDLRVFELKHQDAAEVLSVVRQLLDFPADTNVSTDGSLRMVLDPITGKLIVTGKQDKVAKFDEIVKLVDVPTPPSAAGAAQAIESPQLEVYPISGADPNSVLAVLQTLLASFPDVRLALDPKTFNLIAHARPAQHATIKATIAQMERDSRRLEVIRLARVEPTVAVAAITKLFGADGGAGLAPTVDADPVSRQLLVRGSETQISQIRSLLEKMGETGVAGGTALEGGVAASHAGGNVRMLPLSSRSVRSAMEQVEQLWSTMRANRIQIVAPSQTVPTKRAGELPGARPAQATPDAAPREAAPEKNEQPPVKPLPPARDTRLEPRGVRALQASAVYARPNSGETRSDRVAADNRTVARTDESQPPADKKAPPQDGKEPAPIIVAPGPGGTMIASDDIEALNEFEQLLTTLTSRQFAGGSHYTVYYLANANAQIVAETLESIFASGGASAAGGSLIGDLAGSMIGGTAGSLVSGLLGGGGSGSSSASLASTSVHIIPETRLNALIVRAGPADLDLIETLLEVLDTSELPETAVAPRPRMIPVINTSASQIAEIVKEVYSERLAGNRGNQRQPSPEEFLQALRGGGGSSGRGGSNSRRTAADAAKLSISVDPRTNSLIVAAPNQLFEEVKQMVETLDQQTANSNTAMKVVALKHSNPSTVQKALTAIAGEKVRSDNKVSDSSSGSSSSRGGDNSDADAMRRRMEFFNSLRGGSSSSPFGGSSSGRSSPFGSSRSSSSRGRD